jgi:cytochrome c oxidase assembly protein subunit 11
MFKLGIFRNKQPRVQLNRIQSIRPNSTRIDPRILNSKSSLYYAASVIITFVGLSFAAVPLYQLFCSTTGVDGTPKTGAGTKFELDKLLPLRNAKAIKISFDSSVSDQLPWKFEPETKQITVIPGETALSFFKAKNNTNEDIIGLSTYSVVPYKAAQYFNKIQCFCFEEQRLEAGEEVDMPVFFFIDPEFTSDPWMKDVGEITLHYTFFKSKHQNPNE